MCECVVMSRIPQCTHSSSLHDIPHQFHCAKARQADVTLLVPKGTLEGAKMCFAPFSDCYIAQQIIV